MTGWKRHMTLTQRLLALTAVALLPALAALAYLIVSTHSERARQIHEDALRSGEFGSLEMERILSGAEGTLYALAHSAIVANFEVPDCDSYLAEVATGVPQFRAIAAADTTGRIRCASEQGFAGGNAADTPHFREAMQLDRFAVGRYTEAPAGSSTGYLPLALPIAGEGGPAGVLLAQLDLGWLGERIRGRSFPAGSAMTVADRDGVILAREPQPERFVGTSIPEDFLPLVQASIPGTVALTSQDGTRRVIGYYPPAATGIGLYVSAGLSTEAAFAPINAWTRRSVALAVLGTAGAFLLAGLLGNRLVRDPIRRLVKTVDAWRRGDESARTGISSNTGTELFALAHAIDRYMDELVLDRAALRKAEARRELLFREMEHRIKNILATVQAVAKQTLRGKAAPDGLQDLERRLAAMAETHRILLSESWQRADLRSTLEAALHPFGLIGGERLSLAGPLMEISARAALALSMVVHELGTNATKYGALSSNRGTVSVAWQLVPAEAGDRFVLNWVEADGPTVEEPAQWGFGSKLIRAALGSEFGAEVSLDFRPTGVVFHLDADAGCILASPDQEEAAA
jgi:two-component sensor histidine kinase